MFSLAAFTSGLITVAEQVVDLTASQEDKYPRWASELEFQGYTWEAFEATTEDDYILTVFHITGTKEGGAFTPTKEPVLVQHGHMMDAASWMSDYHENGNKPMPCKLADLGYDVWMGNNRGTEYSQGHTTLSTDDEAYWAFTWAEMGLYDDPANISLVKEKTEVDKIFYVGYS